MDSIDDSIKIDAPWHPGPKLVALLVRRKAKKQLLHDSITNYFTINMICEAAGSKRENVSDAGQNSKRLDVQ